MVIRTTSQGRGGNRHPIATKEFITDYPEAARRFCGKRHLPSL